MFTALIEEIGIVKSVSSFGKGKRFTVSASSVIEDLKIDDSISINGACQTVVSLDSSSFTVEAIEETLRKTTLGNLKSGDKVNLERAMKLNDRLGGHLVQGHVDTVGKITEIVKESAGIQLWINYESHFKKYLVQTGSVCLNGVSLTIARIEPSRFMVAIIPHTWKSTNLCLLHTGSDVNIEFDILGKYIENLMSLSSNDKTNLSAYIDQPDF